MAHFYFWCQVNLLDQSKLFYWDWSVMLTLKLKLYKLSPKNNFCLDLDDGQKEQLFAQKVNKKGYFFLLWQKVDNFIVFWMNVFCSEGRSFFTIRCVFLLFKKVDIFTRFLMFFFCSLGSWRFIRFFCSLRKLIFLQGFNVFLFPRKLTFYKVSWVL